MAMTRPAKGVPCRVDYEAVSHAAMSCETRVGQVNTVGERGARRLNSVSPRVGDTAGTEGPGTSKSWNRGKLGMTCVTKSATNQTVHPSGGFFGTTCNGP